MIGKQLIFFIIAIVFIACKPAKETTSKEAGSGLPHNIPITVFCQPEYLKDSLEYYLKEKKYDLIGTDETERVLKKAYGNFFTEMKRQGTTDKDQMIEKMKRTPVEYYSVTIKFSGDSIKNNIDSANWSVLGFPSMTIPFQGKIIGGQYKWTDRYMILRSVADTLAGGK